MANSKQLIAMIRSHASGDEERFFAVADHIVSDSRKAGHHRMADEIAKLVGELRAETSERRASSRPTLIAAPRGELTSLVRASYPDTRLSDVVLADDVETRLRRIVREHRERQILADMGLQPRRKILLSGPPGTGKTLTAAAIAGELGLPLFTVLLDGVITKYMGETAAKLRIVFDAMQQARGVYFFDEVDALATRRGAENDIGEARRMLNSFLQFLDEDSSGSLILAATNHHELLDRAIFRRFEATVQYALPPPDHVRRILTQHLPQFDLAEVEWNKISAAAEGLSQAEIVAAADDAARDAVLESKGILTNAILLRAIGERIHLKL
ncbi:ATP-binding protein [Sulfitobacter mediterraneus]|uniref:AAA family ATPase n=1 Tax=Sulfitobacter mediterraneus TaxID=83219 RepID=UPI0019337A0A|nr:ATP-binding protein [Sulfitobacter mediterraneus]MBM1633885.1 ATP-binding protein [Sulfitobacter mediterraneus]MBM1641600.1 ATP-binding protein [Sulfitobacter mediterraneus]MBM1645749.1 ATP-binding protein [Sulfitobacter mediterraneus]MBM1649719.1 ATP-binding protein [Sulfitobacter mediterraneus]MBM1653818.1 ATP-binding protein [Sulfitobacter mediterraneus]